MIFSKLSSSSAGIYITLRVILQTILDSNYIEPLREEVLPIIWCKPNHQEQSLHHNWCYGIGTSSSDSTYIYNNLIIIGTGYRGIYNYNVSYLQAINNYIQGSSITSQSGMLIGDHILLKIL